MNVVGASACCRVAAVDVAALDAFYLHEGGGEVGEVSSWNGDEAGSGVYDSELGRTFEDAFGSVSEISHPHGPPIAVGEIKV